MLRALFSKPQVAAEPVPIPVRGPEPDPPNTKVAVDLLDAIEEDVLSAIGSVGRSISAAQSEVGSMQSGLAGIRTQTLTLAEDARTAADASMGLAGWTGGLSDISARIAVAMAQADGHLGQAGERGSEARALIADLAKAGNEIAGIIDAITAVARQTNLLALNATIEASRAGDAGRGFAVVAAEVKALATETARAADEVRARVTRLRDGAAASGTAILAVAEAIDAARPSFATVQSISAEQSDIVERVVADAGRTANLVAGVRANAEVVQASSLVLDRQAAATEASAVHAAEQAAGLGRRFVAVIRQSEIGDRRRHDRYPIDMPVRLSDGRTARSIDLSEGGILLAAPEGAASGAGHRLTLDIDGLGRIDAAVVATGALGWHCAFETLTTTQRASLSARLEDIRTEYAPMTRKAQALAARIAAAMEAEIAAGRLDERALFDTAYVPLPDTEPKQYTTQAVEPLKRLLPEFLEAELVHDNRMLFCIVTDHNGFVPVHNRAASQPQRPGDPAWNTLHCRNQRIFDDRTGITAARSQRPATIQVYRREIGDRVVLVREVDAPIRVLGRHWGACRTAYRF